MLKAGSRAPEIAAADVRGVPQSLSSLLIRTAGPVLVAFYKVSCPTCQYTFPFLQRFADRGLTVVGVSQDGVAATEAFAKRYSLQFPMWLDLAGSGYAASNAYQISHVPSLFLLSAEGTIEHAVEGFSREDLEAMGGRIGFAPFTVNEAIPAFKPG
jgi:peroxiredoxin